METSAITVSSRARIRCTVPGVIRKAAPGVTISVEVVVCPAAANSELGPPLEHVPRLVLLTVELERERVARVDRQELARVVLGPRPDELVAPGLLDPLRLERELIDALQVRRREPAVGHRRIIPLRHIEKSRVRFDVLLGPTQVFRRVHGQPEAFVAKGAQAALRGQLGECAGLVVAALGEPCDRLFLEHVQPRVDPVGSLGASRKPRTTSCSSTSTIPSWLSSGAIVIVAAPPLRTCASNNSRGSRSKSSSPFSA